MRFITLFISTVLSSSILADEYWYMEPIQPSAKNKPSANNKPPADNKPQTQIFGAEIPPFVSEIPERKRPESKKNIVKLKENKSLNRHYKKVNARRSGPSESAIEASYAKLDINSIWTDAGDLNHKGASFLDYVKTVSRHGLIPAEYHLKKINSVLESGGDADKLISRAFVKLATHATLGRLVPKKADTAWYVSQSGMKSQDEFLQEAVTSMDIGAYIESLFPQFAQYNRMLAAYAQIGRQVEYGGWPDFPTAGPKLQQGSRHKHVALLRQRLRDSGYYQGVGDGNMFDASLKSALIEFQDDHGLNADGVLGRITRITLAKSAEQRLKQIQTSLERLRWLPKHLGSRYIIVNTAGYELNLIEYDATSLNMRVVVGKKRRGNKNHETPSFSKKMRHLVLNPKWYVPPSIASEELLVLAQKDNNFFKKQGYKVYNSEGEVNSSKINWNKYVKGEKLPLQIVQDSGSGNALGKIKFMLPNKFNIYLHDTPQKSLFARDRRAFSHGCIRLSKPMALATKVLGKSEPDINAMISTGKNQKVDLDEYIPVYIIYLTAWVRDDGRVIFFDDYFDRDSRMQHNFS